MKGMSNLDASREVNKLADYLKELVKKLKEADKSDKEIEIKVNEALEIKCREYEALRN